MEPIVWTQRDAATTDDLSIITVGNSYPPEGEHLYPPNAALMATTLSYLTVIFIASVIGNSLVLYVIFKHLRCTSITNAFIASLSVSDLLATTICIPWTFSSVIQGGWGFGRASCLLNGLFNNMFGIVSTFMIACVAVDRYYILGTVPRATGTSKKLALITIVWSWAIAAFFAIPIEALVVNRGVLIRENATSTFYHCMFIFHTVEVHAGTAGTQRNAYRVLLIIVCFLAPICIMVYCCARLRRVVKRTDTQIRPYTTDVSQVRFSTEIRTAKTVIFMVLFYVLCRGPYIAMSLVTLLAGRPFTVLADTTCLWLFWTSCAVNPIIYAIRNPIFSQMLHTRRQSAYRVERFSTINTRNGSLSNQFGSDPDLASGTSPNSNCNSHSITRAMTRQTPTAFVAVAEISNVIQCESFPPFFFIPNARKGSTMSTFTNNTNTTTL